MSAWEYCIRTSLHSMASCNSLACLAPAFTKSAAPLAVLWAMFGAKSPALVRTLLRIWKLLLRGLEASEGKLPSRMYTWVYGLAHVGGEREGMC